ncbi:MAG TPA: gamma-glutamyltransferase, partial [Ottowia sp.]|nr:gamma-glutamyltransferase [Ottowia sp.]
MAQPTPKLLLAGLALAVLAACSTPPAAPPPATATPIAAVAPASAAPVAASPTAAAQAAAAAYDFDMDVFHPVVARHGMVATEQELASKIGLDVLKSGGNAVDAAVAIGFALAVALPNAGNVGGGGFMMVYDAKTAKTVAVDFREVGPAAASRDMYLDASGKVIDGKSLYTHYAIGVPGTVAGMTHALQKWGTQPLTKLLRPSIELAEKGYPVSETLAKVLQQETKNMGKWPATKAIYWRNGAPLKAGDRLVQKDLGHSLRLIARDGARAFYEGEIAHKIAADMAKNGNPMTLQDLKNYKVVEREPVRGTYRGYEIVTMP